MTSTVVDPFRKTARSARDPQWMSARVGRIVAAQAAVAGLWAALGHGPIIVTAASTIGGVVVIVAFARVRGRWLHAWLAVGVRYATRRHSLSAHAPPAELMRFLAPDVATATDAAFVDADGLVAVFELDGPLVANQSAALPDLAGLMDAAEDPARGPNRLAADDPRPGPNRLAARDSPRGRQPLAADHPQPGREALAAIAVPAIGPFARIELLVTAAAAPTTGLGSATVASYRQLTGDRVPSQRRTFVVLRVQRPPGWSDDDLRPTMSGATRRVAKRLGPHRRLDAECAAATVAELAHHDGTSGVDERWSFIVIGGLCQATYRVAVPGGDGDTTRTVDRLLTLPTAATTISVISSDRHAQPTDTPTCSALGPPRFSPVLAIRLAAGSPRQLERADQALHQLAAAERATVRRLDGEHRITAAETLLVGGQSSALGLRPKDWSATWLGRSQWHASPTTSARGRPAGDVRAAEQPRLRDAPARTDPPRPRPSPRPRLRHQSSQPKPGAGPLPLAEATTPTRAGAALPPAGLVLGYDRHGIPVAARIFRPVPTQVVLVGGLRTAQLIAFRASALGALIDVRTRRWAAWSWFADEVAAPAGTFTVTPDAAAVPPWAAPWRDGRPDAPGAGQTAGPHAGSVDAANARRPTLTIVDAATRALSAAQRLPHTRGVDRQPGTAAHAGAARWHTVITVRDELASADTGLLAAADLVVLQTLRPDEADLVADTFGLEDAAGYLTGLSDELVGLVGNHQPLSWAALAMTKIERSLIGPADWDRTAPSDVDALQPVTRAGKSPRGGD